jgi:16S rRNA C1402 (ribose-2'-O) methylase RsmI
MDRDLALRLIQPLQEGDEVCPGHTLVSVGVHLDASRPKKDAIHYVFSGNLSLILTRRNNGQCAFQTTHFNMSIRQPDEVLSQPNRQVVGVVKQRLVENDLEAPRDWLDLTSMPAEGSPKDADLWLIPGHIGNPLDLSIRALRVLQSADLLFVEEGSEHAVQVIYEQFELGPLPEVVFYPDGPHEIHMITERLEQGRSSGKVMALFGVDEGIPGICDPGWKVMRAASHLDVPLKIRSLSAGSALSTSLMFMDSPDVPVAFLGLLKAPIQDTDFIKMLNKVKWNHSQSLIAFTNGKDLHSVWSGLVMMIKDFRGRLMLHKNLTLSGEEIKQFMLSQLPPEPPDDLDPDDKIVLRMDVM